MKKPCLDCGVVSEGSRCPVHQVAWDAAHPDRRRKPSDRYSYAYKQIRTRVLERDGWTCVVCQKILVGVDATIDHAIPLKYGGSAIDMSNLQSMCRSCNSSKGARIR